MKIRSLVHVAAALLIFEIAENFSMASSEIFYRFWESAYAVCVSLLSMGLRAAVTEEVIFRGMILGNLRKALGTKAALAVPHCCLCCCIL